VKHRHHTPYPSWHIDLHHFCNVFNLTRSVQLHARRQTEDRGVCFAPRSVRRGFVGLHVAGYLHGLNTAAPWRSINSLEATEIRVGGSRSQRSLTLYPRHLIIHPFIRIINNKFCLLFWKGCAKKTSLRD